MTITYGITEEIYTLGEASRRSFGIAAYVDAAENNTATIVASIHDIASDRAKLAQLVQPATKAISPLSISRTL